MSQSTNEGEELYQVLQDLGINTGNFDPTDISIWFDTDDEDTLDFLHWLTTCIGEGNVLSAQEQKVYEILSDDVVLSDEQYKEAIAGVEMKYPGIFDVESNEFEIECLEEELKMYGDDLKFLEQQIVTNEEINNILKQELSKKSDQEVLAKHKKDKAEQECLTLSKELSEINEKLQAQIKKYGDKLANFSYETSPNFINNMNVKEHNSYINDISTNLKSVIEKNKPALLGSHMKRLMNCSNASLSALPRNKMGEDSFANSTVFDELTEDIQRRLESALMDNISSKARREELEQMYNYLSKLNLFELSAVNDRSQFFESLIASKTEQLLSIKSDIQSLVPDVVKKHIQAPKVYVAQNEIKFYQEKLDYITKISANTDEVLAYLWLLLLMYHQESHDIKITDKFFREVYQYITYNLHNYKVRTDAMLDVINNYSVYKEQPIEQRYHLINNIISIITNKDDVNNVDMVEAVKIMQNFLDEHKNIERRLFCDDFFEFKTETQNVCKNLNNLKLFLTNGPTSEYVVIPHKLYKLYMEIKEIQNHQQEALSSYLQLKQSVEKKLNSNKWFKLRRQLWMYFLQSPKDVVTYIKLIEKEVENSVKSSYS